VEALALAGLTLLVVRGSLFERPRAALPSFLGCAMCLGFWAGLTGAAVVDRGVYSYAAAVRWTLCAGLVSLVATTADFVLAWLDSHTSSNKG
jgi:hypothetical protein